LCLLVASCSCRHAQVIECDDDRKLRNFYDKRINATVDGDCLGEEFAGYVFKISGGNDKQGFCMVQGVATNGRVRLLLKLGSKSYRPRRTGERKRKSVRGCIVGSDLSVLNLVVVKKGAAELPGITDDAKPRRLGPKRATSIRKLFNLKNVGVTKKEKADKVKKQVDDVRKYTVRRVIDRTAKGKKNLSKGPKIQRLVTANRLQRKRAEKAAKVKRGEATKAATKEYAKLKAERAKEEKAQRREKSSRRASSTGKSH